jgi:hypothetical protein
MQKYTLKLEMLTQSETLGIVVIGLQYDAQGAKLIMVNGESENMEAVRPSLGAVMKLVNFSLSKGIAPSEIARQLEVKPDAEKNPFNEALTLLANSLKEAPAKIQDIQPEVLLQISSEAVDEFNASL